MARGASVNPLVLRNFTFGEDSIECKYDESMSDKEGVNYLRKIFTQTPWIFDNVGGQGVVSTLLFT